MVKAPPRGHGHVRKDTNTLINARKTMINDSNDAVAELYANTLL